MGELTKPGKALDLKREEGEKAFSLGRESNMCRGGEDMSWEPWREPRVLVVEEQMSCSRAGSG